MRPATLGFPKLSKASLYGIPALWPCQLPPALFGLSDLCHTTLSCLLGGYAKSDSQPFSFAAFPYRLGSQKLTFQFSLQLEGPCTSVPVPEM